MEGCQTPTVRVPGWCWRTSMRLRESAADEAATVCHYLSNTSHTMDVWSTLHQPKDGCLEPWDPGELAKRMDVWNPGEPAKRMDVWNPGSDPRASTSWPGS